MSTYTINGCKIQFPCKPYPSQLAMMSKLIGALSKSKNCLLESPTGSGKSLALLCAVLAYQKQQYDKYTKNVDCVCKDRIIPQDTKTESTHSKEIVSPERKIKKENLNEKNVESDINIEEKKNMNNSIILLSSADDDDDFIEESPFKPKPKRLHSDDNDPKNSKKAKQSCKCKSEGDDIEDIEDLCGSTISEDAIRTRLSKFKTPYKSDIMVENPNFVCKCPAKDNILSVPKIYFGSRTHKQITQIIRELNKTNYKNTRMSILASRERTCIDPVISREPNKNENCSIKIKNGGCLYQDSAKRLISQSSLAKYNVKSAWDLEDITAVCRNKAVKACPYYAVRQLKDQADIIFCPYNYLIEPSIRTSMMINLKGAIVVFDEAHNIEDCSRESGDVSCTDDDLVKLSSYLTNLAQDEISPKEHMQLNEFVVQIQTFHNNYKNQSDAGNKTNARTMNSLEVRNEFKSMNFNLKRFSQLQAVLAEVTDTNGQEDADKIMLPMQCKTLLESLFRMLVSMYSRQEQFFDDIRVVMVREIKKVQISQNENQWLKKQTNFNNRFESKIVFTLNFWLMNPGAVFSELDLDSKSLIVSSGTLSPLNSFSSELCVPFPITLEANHVIDKSKVWVGALGRGSNGCSLIGTYKNTETFDYQDEIGTLILEVCNTVPAGVLCFVSSYRMMKNFMERWKVTGMYERMFDSKVVMQEPRGNSINFDEFIREFERQIKETATNSDGPNQINGVLLFAVCRGKISEGLDFSDDNARAVITIGIPYPNFTDQQIQLKMKYNSMHISKGLLSGEAWYEIQAFRALNQALGRCIRHKNDWGALIIVDQRFITNAKKISGLSKWVREKCQLYNDSSFALDSLRLFCERNKNQIIPSSDII